MRTIELIRLHKTKRGEGRRRATAGRHNILKLLDDVHRLVQPPEHDLPLVKQLPCPLEVRGSVQVLATVEEVGGLYEIATSAESTVGTNLIQAGMKQAAPEMHA